MQHLVHREQYTYLVCTCHAFFVWLGSSTVLRRILTAAILSQPDDSRVLPHSRVHLHHLSDRLITSTLSRVLVSAVHLHTSCVVHPLLSSREVHFQDPSLLVAEGSSIEGVNVLYGFVTFVCCISVVESLFS